MSYIIDGHNLIPKIAGMSLSEMDDEARLIQLLVSYCKKKKSRVLVFFDRAAPGHQGIKKYGAVTAYFVSENLKADDAIHRYLLSHHRETCNFTVVSSDHQVQRDACALKARVLSAEMFAKQLRDLLDQKVESSKDLQNELLSPDEVAEWENLFLGYNNKTKL